MIMVAEPDQDLNNNPLEALCGLAAFQRRINQGHQSRKHFLRHLTSALKDKTISGEYYRETVDEVLRNFS